MFFTRYLRRGSLVNDNVPLSLIPPDITLTPEQEFFAGGNYLRAFDGAGSECRVNLTWETGGQRDDNRAVENVCQNEPNLP